MSETPQTEEHFLPIIDEGRRASGRTPDFCRSLEIDRNRWRSVAEQAMEALDEIRYPVAHMRKRLEPGEQLNGAMAIQLGSDPSYLKEIADKALSAFDSLRKGAPERRGAETEPLVPDGGFDFGGEEGEG